MHVVKFHLQLIISPHFCSVIWIKPRSTSIDGQCCHAKSGEYTAWGMGMDYFQRQWSHAHKAEGDKMKNLISYLMTRLDMIGQDGSPGHMHMINSVTKYRDEIF